MQVLELRIYRCPGAAHLQRLDEQLAVDGVPMFARNGVTIVDAWIPGLGAPSNRLLYLCGFDDLQARDAAWRSVDADAQWQQDKKKWSEGLGPLTSELEFWTLDLLGPLRLAPGERAGVLLGLTTGQPNGAGWCRVALGPVGRRLLFADASASPHWPLPTTDASDRLIRMTRCRWSPAVSEGVRLETPLANGLWEEPA